MNRRSLESFSPWGHKELDMMEHLSTYILPAVYEGPSFFTSCQHLLLSFCLFGWLVLCCNHRRKYEVLPHLDFDSHFLSSYWYQASFHILTGHYVSSLEKCLFRSLPIFNWVICLLVIAFAGQLLKKNLFSVLILFIIYAVWGSWRLIIFLLLAVSEACRILFPDLSFQARDWTCPLCLGNWSLNHWTTREVYLCSLKSNSLPPLGSSVHGIFQPRILEWTAIPSPGDLPDPRIEPVSPALQADSLPLCHRGSPQGSL